MIRLFLKLYGLLIATLALSFVVQMQLMDYAWRHISAGQESHERFRPTFHLLDQAFEGLAPGARAARLAELSRGFGVPARIEAAGRTRAAMPPAQSAALAAGAIVTLKREAGGFSLVKLTRDRAQAVTLDFPGPRASDVRMLTYAINWAVEFLIVAVLVFFWVRPFWRDLRALHAAADSVGEARRQGPVAVGRFSALRPLAEAFDAMAARIDGLLRSHRSLTSAVSHELRTPLARLRFSHSLAREETSAQGKDAYLARMERDIAQIDELTTELLGYARLERESPAMRLQEVPAEAWLEDALADADGADRGSPAPAVALRVAVACLECEPRYMARAVANLVRNARMHARGTVQVSLRQDGPRTVIDVDDDGDGIPPSDRERVFEPFVRLDPSRSRDSGGFGLGLAIARQIARWHGGDVFIGDSPLGGARISIVW